MDLSIVIPALNEANKINADMEAAAAFLQAENLIGEIIVVDDGSIDGTGTNARSVKLPPQINSKVITLPKRQGKGYALRQGVAISTGAIILFADSGNCTPYQAARKGMAMIKSGQCIIAIASRRHPQSIIHRPQSHLRQTCSRLYMNLIHRLLNLQGQFTDTQCGFKLLAGKPGRNLFTQCQTNGFMIDLELILRAQNQNLKINEFPITWTCDPDTRLKPLPTLISTLKETLTLRKIKNTW